MVEGRTLHRLPLWSGLTQLTLGVTQILAYRQIVFAAGEHGSWSGWAWTAAMSPWSSDRAGSRAVGGLRPGGGLASGVRGAPAVDDADGRCWVTVMLQAEAGPGQGRRWDGAGGHRGWDWPERRR